MRKLFLQINVSLDGFIEDADHEIDWHFSDDEFEAFIVQTLRSIDGMIFGRRAYEPLSGYWPTAAANPGVSARHVEMAELMHRLPKYVVSNTLERTEWHNAHLVRGDVAGQIRRLKQQPGKGLALFAGAGVASSFIGLRLVDEYRLILNPVLIGQGTPLFQGGYARQALRLLETRRFDSGALVLRYASESADRTETAEAAQA